jgi:hypothetical protein
VPLCNLFKENIRMNFNFDSSFLNGIHKKSLLFSQIVFYGIMFYFRGFLAWWVVGVFCVLFHQNLDLKFWIFQDYRNLFDTYQRDKKYTVHNTIWQTIPTKGATNKKKVNDKPFSSTPISICHFNASPSTQRFIHFERHDNCTLIKIKTSN